MTVRAPASEQEESPRLSRRDAVRLIGVAGAAGFLTADGFDSAVAAQADADSLIEIPDSGVELPTEDLTFRWLDSGGLKAFFFEEFFPRYEQAHPNVTIQYDVLPWPEIAEVVPLGAQNGTLHDVFQLPPNTSGAQAVQQGWLQPLDDHIPNFAEWKAAFPPGVFLPGITDFDEKTYGFPLWSTLRHGTLTLYNVAYLEQAGYDPAAKPLTWDEFRDAARKITEQGQGQYYGFIIGGQQTGRWSEVVSNLARMAGASGGSGRDAGIDWSTGQYNYTADQYIGAIELLLVLEADGSIFPGAISLNAQQARAQFPQGAAGIIIQGPWNVPQWEQDNPDFNFGVASQPVPNSGEPLPITVGPGSGDLFWLFADSPYATIAGDIFAYVGSKPGQAALLQLSGGSSPVLFPELNEEAPEVGPRARTALELFARQVRLGPSPVVRNPEVEQVYLEMAPVQPDLGQVVQGLISGQLQDARAVLQDLQDRSEAELERAIAAAQEKGAQVSRDDWVFPNWDPTRDYTAEDYAALEG